MTYLEIVNKVLRRLRENEVSSVQETPYSKLIGELVNVVKREVEDSWDWHSLRTVIPFTTSASTYNYTLANTSTRTRIIDILNDTDNFFLENKGTRWFDSAFYLGASPTQQSSPFYYNVNGISSTGELKLDVYPVPDKSYNIRVNCLNPQSELSADADVLISPYQVIIEGTISRAISERGDDGGSIEQEQKYHSILSDLIAFESAQRMDEITWNPY